MTHIVSKWTGIGWRVLGAAVGPFFVLSVYLFLTRWPSSRFTTFTDYAGLAGSGLVGVAFILTLPIRVVLRLLLTLVYIPVVGLFLWLFTIWFIVAVFHDGL